MLRMYEWLKWCFLFQTDNRCLDAFSVEIAATGSDDSDIMSDFSDPTTFIDTIGKTLSVVVQSVF